VCVVEKWRTKMFSWADGSFSNLFIAFNGKSSVEKGWRKRERRKKEGTKPQDGKHTHAMKDTTNDMVNVSRKVKSMMPTWKLKTLS
jgi:hypothetical protein